MKLTASGYTIVIVFISSHLYIIFHLSVCDAIVSFSLFFSRLFILGSFAMSKNEVFQKDIKKKIIDNQRFKNKCDKNMPLLSSPPLLSKDNRFLELDLPDGFSSFDLPQLQSIHTRSLNTDSNKQNTGTIVQQAHIATNITIMDNTPSYVKPFSKLNKELGRMQR